MSQPSKTRRAGPRDLQFFAEPALWPKWPFLPVIRPAVDGSGTEYGVLYDARNASCRYGYSTTVWLTNLLLLPEREEEFLALPRISYDTVDELADNGWCVD